MYGTWLERGEAGRIKFKLFDIILFSDIACSPSINTKLHNNIIMLNDHPFHIPIDGQLSKGILNYCPLRT